MPTVLPSTRREFLQLSSKGIGLLAFGGYAPQFLVQATRAAAPPPEPDRRILVLVQLAGGNDGLNTLAPGADDAYYRLRPTLALPREKLLPVDDHSGLHPACAPLHQLFGEGKLAIVQNVGYPNPNRSHFRSTEIWETASDSDTVAATGWIGRYLDHTCGGRPRATPGPLAVHATAEGVPQAFTSAETHPTFGLVPGARGRREHEDSRQLLEQFAAPPAADTFDALAGNGAFLRQTLMDTLVTERKVQRTVLGYRPSAPYPATPFGGSLRSIAALIAARMPTRVYFASLGGFDTHSGQVNQHAQLLTQLANGLAAFQRDLEHHGLADQVLTMTFSEFGRRPAENQSRGTDHGTAAPLFLLGPRVAGGLHGTAPSLDLGPNQDLEFSTDFRAVYASLLDRWLGADADAILGTAFPRLDIFSSLA